LAAKSKMPPEVDDSLTEGGVLVPVFLV